MSSLWMGDMQEINLDNFKQISKWTYEIHTVVISMASGASVLPLITQTYEKLLGVMDQMYLPSKSNADKSVERIINKVTDKK